jgi:hypothetical protein
VQTINAVNVNEAWAIAKLHIWEHARPVLGRTGPVYRLPEPLAVRFRRPRERVLFDTARNANPFFHLMEALWMLGGRNDVEWIAGFNRRMRTFSADGATLPASYGYRWRRHFGHDQLAGLVAQLRDDPTTRRAVLGMWDSRLDQDEAHLGALDVPCNLVAAFTVRDDGRGADGPGPALCLAVFNRSNDLSWGLFGANVVHFSVLQEYVADWLALPVGWYEHITVDPHIYPDHYPAPVPDGTGETYPGMSGYDPYQMGLVAPGRLMREPEAWAEDLEAFLDPRWEEAVYGEPFFVNVARPMRRAWLQRKLNPELALETAAGIRATDWRRAAVEWLGRYFNRDTKEEAPYAG